MPAIIIAALLVTVLFLNLIVSFTPKELPDKLVLTNTIRRDNRPIKSQRVEITDTDEIAELIGCFDDIFITGVGKPLRTLFSIPGEEVPHRRITFEYSSGVSFYYDFDYDYIERNGKAFRILGDPLTEIIRVIDESDIS